MTACCRWLKSFYSMDGLRVLQFDSEDLVKNIKESITAGTTVIVEVLLKIHCHALGISPSSS